MSGSRPLCAQKRTSAGYSKFMDSRLWHGGEGMPSARWNVHKRADDFARRANLPQSGSLISTPNQKQIARIPSHIEGRIAIVTDAGWDAMDAGGASDEGAGLRTAKSCGPDASTLASSWRSDPLTTVTTKPDHRGERGGNR